MTRTAMMTAPNIRYRTVRIFIAVPIGPPGGSLKQPLLELLLAGDAVARPRHRLEALLLDLLAALDAGAVAGFGDPLQGLVHFLQNLAVRVRQGVQELLRVGARRLVGQILRSLVFGQPAVVLVLVVRLRDTLLLLEKALSVSFEQFLRHRHRGASFPSRRRSASLRGFRNACVSRAGSCG